MWTIEKDPLLRSTITSVALFDAALDQERLLRARPSHPAGPSAAPAGGVTRRSESRRPAGSSIPNFDLDYHVRWMRAPGEGTLRDLLDVAQPIAMQRLRSRPTAVGVRRLRRARRRAVGAGHEDAPLDHRRRRRHEDRDASLRHQPRAARTVVRCPTSRSRRHGPRSALREAFGHEPASGRACPRAAPTRGRLGRARTPSAPPGSAAQMAGSHRADAAPGDEAAEPDHDGPVAQRALRHDHRPAGRAEGGGQGGRRQAQRRVRRRRRRRACSRYHQQARRRRRRAAHDHADQHPRPTRRGRRRQPVRARPGSRSRSSIDDPVERMRAMHEPRHAAARRAGPRRSSVPSPAVLYRLPLGHDRRVRLDAAGHRLRHQQRARRADPGLLRSGPAWRRSSRSVR